MFHLEVFSKICKAKLVAIFEVTVSWIMLLDGIICQMHPIIGKGGRIGRVLTGACTDVTLFEEEAVEALCYEDPNPYIKFSALYK